jgi:antitoxin component YwqK of YwqJK toxin-antitoxin module
MSELDVIDRIEVITYYKKGTNILHREDGPAYIDKRNGYKEWHNNGKLHRVGAPATELSDGSYEWYENGKRHRVGGPAKVSVRYNIEEWYKNGELHREDGPAIINHRVLLHKFYLEGELLSKESWFEKLTEEQKVKAFYSEYFMGS